MEIVAGLQSSSVHRLKKTWAGVKGKSMAKYDELRELMNNRLGGSYFLFKQVHETAFMHFFFAWFAYL